MLALIFFNSKPPYKTLKIWSFEVLNLLLKLFLCWRAKGMFDWSVVACDHKHINIVLWSDKSMTRGEWLQLQVNVRLVSDSLVWCHYQAPATCPPLILSRGKTGSFIKIFIEYLPRWEVEESHRCLLVVYFQEKEAGYRLIFQFWPSFSPGPSVYQPDYQT